MEFAASVKSVQPQDLKPSGSVRATVIDYNTDQGNGTHLLCSKMLEEGNYTSAEVFSKSLDIKSETLHAMMLTRVQHATNVAQNLAKKAKAEASSLSEAIFSILDRRGIRRGAAKSEIGRAGCLREIEAALARPDPLRLAVLTFPFRDRHPFKNVGALPDAGEAESLIRLWTIAKAISCLGVPCKVVALRDGTRYPSTWHYPIEEKRRYGDGFRDLVQALDSMSSWKLEMWMTEPKRRALKLMKGAVRDIRSCTRESCPRSWRHLVFIVMCS
jgi:hypothetical protein